MELSVRSYNCLKAASIETLDELLSWKPAQLMELPNFGSKCLSEIIDIVRQFGYLRSVMQSLLQLLGQDHYCSQNDLPLAVQQNRAETGVSAEDAFNTKNDQIILRPTSQTMIADLELSVRAYKLPEGCLN